MKNIRFVLGILFLGSFAISLTACSGSSRSVPTGLLFIVVTPVNPSIPVGVTQQFTATATNSDGTSQDITTQATWSSSITSVATVNKNTGLATAVATGSTTITASFGGKAGNTTLTVTSATLSFISVTPDHPNIPVGLTQQFAASGVYSDGTSSDITTLVTWSASDASATVDRSGLATAATPGTPTITATFGGKSEKTTLTVTSAALSSISVTPINPSIPMGLTQQFAASGAYSDGTSFDITTQATWDSSNTSFAMVNKNTGLATAVAVGTPTITATFGGKSGTTTLTVTSASLSSISVTPTNLTMPAGFTQQLTATGAYSDATSQTSHDISTQVTWTSSNPSVATVNGSGLATALSPGTITITATFTIPNSVPTSTLSWTAILKVTAGTLSSISVTPINPSIPVGLTQQFAAWGIYSDGTSFDITTQVIWTSSDTSMATVNSSGLATTVAAGNPTIKATITTPSGTISGKTNLPVTLATLFSISVTPANPSLPSGVTQQFTAMGIYFDGTSHDITAKVTWTSSDTSMATVNSSGLATGVAAGTPTITATFGGKSENTALTVTSETLSFIYVTPANSSMHVGFTQQFTATGVYSDGTEHDITSQVTWSSSKTQGATVNPVAGSVVTIDSNGLVTAVAGGLVTITATITTPSGTIARSTTLLVR